MVLELVGLTISVPELIWTIITFLVLMFLLKKVLYEPVFKILDARKENLEDARIKGEMAEKDLNIKEAQLSEELDSTLLEARNMLTKAKENAEKNVSCEALKTANEVKLRQQQIREEVDLYEKEISSFSNGKIETLVDNLADELLGKSGDK